MRKTIREKLIDEMAEQGFQLIGSTTGLYSERKGSNLHYLMQHLGKSYDDENIKIRIGARAGRNRNDGNQLLVFCKE